MAHLAACCLAGIEVQCGNAGGLFAVARRFAADTVLRLSFESKAERGYRLVAGETPAARNFELKHIPGDIIGTDAFARIMRACLAHVCSNAHLLRETRDAEVLHQLRVGLHRLRAALVAFKSILPGKKLLKLGADIKWMGSELDRARDLDVFIENDTHFRKNKNEDDPRSRRLGDRLTAAQTAGYDRALAAASSHRFAMLMLDCSEWVEIGSWRRSRLREVAALRARACFSASLRCLRPIEPETAQGRKAPGSTLPHCEASRQN